jgi:hypothetical protein
VADVGEEEAFVDGDVGSVLVVGGVGGALVRVPFPYHVRLAARGENGMDTAEYMVIPYPTLIYFSWIQDQIQVVKIQDGYRTEPGNNSGG